MVENWVCRSTMVGLFLGQRITLWHCVQRLVFLRLIIFLDSLQERFDKADTVGPRERTKNIVRLTFSLDLGS